MSGRFRVGLSGDLRDGLGNPSFGTGPLRLLDVPGIEWCWLEPAEAVDAATLAAFDALYINTPRVAAAALAAAAPLRTRIIARHGVGYDSVDVAACTDAGVLVTIQPEGVRRPVAVAALTLVLALSQRLLIKDRLTRNGGWAARQDHMGTGLIGRTLGVIGAGRIGRELLALARPFGLRLLAADPQVAAEALAPLDTSLVPLDILLAESDFVVILTPLTPQTRGLIGAGALARMKPTAQLVNIARGPVVDEAALIAALRAGQIAGAALDVFEAEPVAPDNPLLAMDQVIVTPHALSWTDQCFAGIAESGLRSILAVRDGRVPDNALNPEAAARH